jgi:3-deoxy-D-manno-octulosonate 8-phosphate phosphatase (KDO 8-P phosphatase)
MLHQNKKTMNVLELFAPIKVFVLDIDGVLTDGTLHVQEDGELLRRMNIKDGYALQLAVKKNYNVWIISGGQSIGVKNRLEKLGITHVYLAVENKKILLQQLMLEQNFSKEQYLYMGDDMPDVAAMQLCGLRTCPADAVAEIKNTAQYISPIPGGQGCVRDVIEKTLKLNNDWE